MLFIYLFSTLFGKYLAPYAENPLRDKNKNHNFLKLFIYDNNSKKIFSRYRVTEIKDTFKADRSNLLDIATKSCCLFSALLLIFTYIVT